MNRRGFFKGLCAAVVTAAAQAYVPSSLRKLANVDGPITGVHFDVVIMDDIVDVPGIGGIRIVVGARPHPGLQGKTIVLQTPEFYPDPWSMFLTKPES